ncbi:MAG: thrombospondin type-1 domain-containing protein [Candidatus Absconditabacteria bacterium]
MAKSIRKFLKSFTLIELIIVIAIIVVLGVAAFLVLTQWMSKGRDAQRISDLSTIKTALDIALSKNDKLPAPDEANVLLYSGTEILYQGLFGDQVVKSIGTLNKVPRDRVNGLYEYSLLEDMKTYKIKAVMENEQYKSAFVQGVFAGDDYYRYIGKDLKGIIVQVKFLYLPNMFITGYVNKEYDLLNGTNVFLGDKVGFVKTGGIAQFDNYMQIKSMLVGLGIEENQVYTIISQGTGIPQDKVKLYTSYAWVFGTWSTCSATCGGGTQNTTVTCQDSQGNELEDLKCFGEKPATSRACNIMQCGMPYDLTMDHLSNSKTFKVSWKGLVNGATTNNCKLQYLKDNSVWTDLITGLNCDNDLVDRAVNLPSTDLWTNSFHNTKIRVFSISNSKIIEFENKLQCLVMSGSTTVTPNIDENCNGKWDDQTRVGEVIYTDPQIGGKDIATWSYGSTGNQGGKYCRFIGKNYNLALPVQTQKHEYAGANRHCFSNTADNDTYTYYACGSSDGRTLTTLSCADYIEYN